MMTNPTPLPAGCELDERIARDVMGWTQKPDSPYWHNTNGRPWLGDELGYLHVGHWHPSTNIEDAWQVVKQMRYEHGYDVSIGTIDDEFPDGMPITWWECRFTGSGLGSRDGEAEDHDAMLAICRAALAAIGNSDA